MIPIRVLKRKTLTNLVIQCLAVLGVCLAQTARADWPLRDKDLRGSRSHQGASRSVSLPSYAKQWEIPGANFVLTGDVQGDDKLEVVAWTPTTIKIYDAAGNELHAIAISEPIPGGLADVDGDGKKEILAGKKEDDYSLSICIFKGDGTEIKRIAIPPNP